MGAHGDINGLIFSRRPDNKTSLDAYEFRARVPELLLHALVDMGLFPQRGAVLLELVAGHELGPRRVGQRRFVRLHFAFGPVQRLNVVPVASSEGEQWQDKRYIRKIKCLRLQH